jgi:hypothetical protein
MNQEQLIFHLLAQNTIIVKKYKSHILTIKEFVVPLAGQMAMNKVSSISWIKKTRIDGAIYS